MVEPENVAKLKLTLGPLQFEFEGSEQFLREELSGLIGKFAEMKAKIDITKFPSDGGAQNDVSEQVQATTGTMAAKLQAKSGPDLILASAAKLTFNDRKETFTRDEIIAEMRSAPAYFKETYVNNLSKYLQNLVKKDTIYESKKNTYALSAKSSTELRAKVAP